MLQFQIKGLKLNGQATPTTRLTILINKSVHANFDRETQLNFTINGDLREWPTTNGIPNDVYSFTPTDLGLIVSEAPYKLSLEYSNYSDFEADGDTLGEVDIRVVGTVVPLDDPNTYILAPFVSKINSIDLSNGKISLEQSWEEFEEKTNLNPKIDAITLFENAKISYKANEVRDLNNYINFGDDNKVLITNIKADRELFSDSPYSIVLKLYEPLDDEIQEKDNLFVVREILPQLTETVELIPYEQEDENVNVLFTPDSVNVQAPISKRQLFNKNKQDIITSDKKSSNYCR